MEDKSKPQFPVQGERNRLVARLGLHEGRPVVGAEYIRLWWRGALHAQVLHDHMLVDVG